MFDRDQRRPNPEEVTVTCTTCYDNPVLVHEDLARMVSSGEREAECLGCRGHA